MTEEEAKTKWCPFDRWSAGQAQGGDAPRCAGSGCMAWRPTMRTEVRDKRDGSLLPPGTIVLRGVAETVSVPNGGYCGLAGAPA